MNRRWLGVAAAAALVVMVTFRLTGNSADEAPAAASEPENVAGVAVTVAPIVRTTLHGYVSAWGVVESEPALEDRPPAGAAIAAPVAGLISVVLAGEGQHVGADETLIRLDSRVADVAVQRAQEAVDYAEQVLRRQEQLVPGEATSIRAYQDARQQLTAAHNELARTEVERGLLDIKAPFSGTIVRNYAKLGQPVDPSMVLIELVDLDRLVATLSVRSVEASRVKFGQRIDLSPSGMPGAATLEDVSGAVESEEASENFVSTRVGYIGAQVIAASDTVLVRGRVPSGGSLRPGQFVAARIAVDERAERLAIPVDSVVQGRDGAEIVVVEGDTAVRRRVRTGLREGGLIEVSGDELREGMRVVVQGAYGLPQRSRIQIIDP